MANWVIPDEGKTVWLDRALLGAATVVEDYTLRLFTNNYTPVDGSTLADFTEATFTGYAAVAVGHSGFPASTITGDVAYSDWGNAVFSCTGGGSQTVYGCYLEGNTSGVCLAAARFDTPRVMASGSTETITVEFGLKTFV